MSEVRALARDLHRADDVLDDVHRALDKTAADIERDAKVLAPVDTGNLRASIGTTSAGLSRTIGPTTHYGAYLEYGHRIVAWGHETGRYAAPRPYMIPASIRNEPGFLAAMAQIGLRL